MIFQDNIIKEYLRNVYFISGTPCGGKTTITKALGEKYNIPVYVIDDQIPYHIRLSDKEHQPEMNRDFKDADEFFGRTVEEYKNWLIKKQAESEQTGLVDGWKVPSTTYWLCVDGAPVGFGNVRRFLTEALRKTGGNIGRFYHVQR